MARRKSRQRHRVWGWLKLVGIGLAISLGLVWQRVQVVRVGREVHAMQVERRRLLDEVRDLRAQYERATGYEVIRKRAEKELGFGNPPVKTLTVDMR